VSDRPWAKKSLGQNFLVDSSVAGRIVSAASVGSADVVVEIGPGRGALTGLLRSRSSQLICIEKDDALSAELVRHSADDPSWEVVRMR
jgi:16S rRNA (adenine1518-N6/adenine1519-N6)-dimethyltransferase